MSTQNEIAVKTTSSDSRKGNHSYTGWNITTRYLIDGNVYEHNRGCGAFMGREGAREIGPVNDSFVGTSWQDLDGGIESLPAQIQKLAGILVPVPDGCILCIKRYSYNRQSIFDMEWCETYGEGTLVPPMLLKTETLLRDGERFPYTYFNRGKAKKMLITNKNGKAVDERDPEDVEREQKARKSFARDQINFLKEKGFSHKHAVRIMKAGGPGAVVPAWEWVRSVSPEHLDILRAALHGTRSWFPEAEGHIRASFVNAELTPDASDVLLYGIGERTNFGKDRQANALQKIGLGTPKYRSSGSLFSALQAAKEMVVIPEGVIDPEWKEQPVKTQFGNPWSEIPQQYRRFDKITLGEVLKQA